MEKGMKRKEEGGKRVEIIARRGEEKRRGGEEGHKWPYIPRCRSLSPHPSPPFMVVTALLPSTGNSVHAVHKYLYTLGARMCARARVAVYEGVLFLAFGSHA